MITLSDSFFELPFVKDVIMEHSINGSKIKFPELIVHSVYEENFELTVPAGAIVHGISKRTG